MVKHIVLWKLKESYSEEEKCKIKKDIKTNLEGLLGFIDGLIDTKVVSDGLSSSTSDIALFSTFKNYQALKEYSVNPNHVAVANTYVRPHISIRSCFDYEE